MRPRNRPAEVARRRAERRGRLAEHAAALLLRLKGYRVLARRFKTEVGEIDLIARRGATIAFVEVKRRASGDAAIMALGPRQRRRLVRAAEAWLSRHPAALGAACRFDIVVVRPYLVPRHIENAFLAGE